MEKLKIICHIWAEKATRIELVEQVFKEKGYQTFFIFDTVETLSISTNGLDIVVIQPTLSNWEWLDELMIINQKFPDLPVFVYSPEIDFEKSMTADFEKKCIFFTSDLDSLRERAEEMIKRKEESKKKILLVDDDQNTLNSYVRMLRKTPWEILATSSGKKALEILKNNAIQLVVTDIKMPEMHGIELLSKIRENNNTLPVVVCSAYPGMKDDQNLKMYGVTDFVEKPVEADALKRKLNEILTA